MSPSRAGICLRWLRALLLSLNCASSTASAATHLQWMQPAGSPAVSEFRVYAGPAPGQGDLVYAGMPEEVEGVYSVDVQIDPIDQGLPVAVWLIAWNESGESEPSNALSFGEPCDLDLDADCDGFPDADDNCPYTANPGQEDAGGLGSVSLPDGIGNDCQCGDVSGDGHVTTADGEIIMRALMMPRLASTVRLELCDVGASLGCTTADSAIVMRALMTPPLAAIQPVCEPAQPPAP